MKIETTFLSQFSNDILIKCPACGSCSHLIKLAEVTGYRLVCHSCSYTNEWSLKSENYVPEPGVGPTLWGFDLDLWLQTNCCGHILWAYNIDHINFLTELVEAKLRERKPDSKWGWCKASLESRLPKWILSAKNRDDVLKDLTLLRKYTSA